MEQVRTYSAKIAQWLYRIAGEASHDPAEGDIAAAVDEHETVVFFQDRRHPAVQIKYRAFVQLARDGDHHPTGRIKVERRSQIGWDGTAKVEAGGRRFDKAALRQHGDLSAFGHFRNRRQCASPIFVEMEGHPVSPRTGHHQTVDQDRSGDHRTCVRGLQAADGPAPQQRQGDLRLDEIARNKNVGRSQGRDPEQDQRRQQRRCR